MKKLINTAALAVIFTLAFGATAFAIATTTSTTAFPDTAGHVYEPDIKFIADNGLVSGYDDGSYKPDALINRAEFSKIIIGAPVEGADVSAYNNCFKDVKDEWYAIYVCFAKDKGIIQGYDDGNFRPTNNISIAEASKIIIGGLMGTKITDTAGVEWYVPYMEKLAYYNAVPPTLKYKAADTQITRGEMAYMISTLIQWKAAREGTTSTETLSATGNVYGNADADVSIVVFSDFECPFCKIYHATAKKIVDESDGTVNLEYKNFPLVMHENAHFEAAAGECMAMVGDNDQYWKFIDFLFAESFPDVYSLEVPVIATGMDVIVFYECLAKDEPWDQVDADYRLGLSIGVTETPASVIRNNSTGGVLAFQGALTESQLQEAIAKVKAD